MCIRISTSRVGSDGSIRLALNGKYARWDYLGTNLVLMLVSPFFFIALSFSKRKKCGWDVFRRALGMFFRGPWKRSSEMLPEGALFKKIR